MATQKLRLRARSAKDKLKKYTNGKVIPFPTTKRKAADAVDRVVIDTKKVTRGNAAHMIKSIMEESGRNDVRIGGILAKVKAESWYDQPTFGEHVYKTYGFTLRKAQYLILSYETIEKLGLHERDIRGIGWSKFRLIAPLLDEKNKQNWIKRAKKATMATLENLTKKARRAKAGVGGSAEPGAHDKITIMRFQLHKDQARTANRALTEASRVCNTKHPAVAFDYINTSFLSSVDKAPKPLRLRDILSRTATEYKTEGEALRYINREVQRAFPTAGVKIGARAKKEAEQAKAPSKKKTAKKSAKKAAVKKAPVKAEPVTDASDAAAPAA